MNQNIASRADAPVRTPPLAGGAGRDEDAAEGGKTGEPKADSDEVDPPSAVTSAIRHITRIGEEMHTLLALRGERRLRKARRWIALGIVGALAALALVPLVLAGLYLVVAGTVQGFTELFEGRIWLANLASGTLILGCIAVIAFAAWSFLSRSEQARMVAEYGDIPDTSERSKGSNDGAPSPPNA